MNHFDQSSIQIDLPVQSGSVCNILDYGAKAETGFCNTEAFRRAIDFCKKNPKITLVIPKGVYHFYETKLNYFIGLHSIKDLIINGNGSEFIFHEVKDYVDINNCERLFIKNLTFDWDWDEGALASVGVISHVEKEGEFIDVKFPSYETIDDQMDIRIVGPFDKESYTPGAKNGIEFRPYKNEHIKPANNDEVDEKMADLVRELDNILTKKIEKISSNTLRLYTQNPSWSKTNFRVGDCYNFRHYEYDCKAIKSTNSSHITFNRITIYGCPGGGFLSSGSVHHLHFDHCIIKPRPGTSRSISISVDCLHVGNSQGNILIEDCDFSYAGDDCVNLHDNSSMGLEIVNDSSISIDMNSQQRLQFEIGNQLELRNPDLSPSGYCSEIMGLVFKKEENKYHIELKDRLPSDLSKESIIFNRNFGTDYYIIRNCRFSNNRARGLLLQGSHGLVEHNIFENIQGAAIQIETGCESRWSEGQGVKDLLIAHNIIRNCDLNAWQMAIIYMGVYLPNGRTNYSVFKDIEICSNTIVNFPRLACFLSSCENVSVHSNTFINGAQFDFTVSNYGSSTMERPIYNEKYYGIVQFSHNQNCFSHDNHIFSTL